jgi:lycopene beta-cyclase
MTKGSTGYTFHRSQRQARHLAETLTRYGEPTPLPAPSFRFRFYDAVLLRLLARRPDTGRRAFSQLFRENSYADVLRFLDEQTRLGDEARLFSALPFAPFLRALAQVAPALPALRAGHA